METQDSEALAILADYDSIDLKCIAGEVSFLDKVCDLMSQNTLIPWHVYQIKVSVKKFNCIAYSDFQIWYKIGWW